MSETDFVARSLRLAASHTAVAAAALHDLLGTMAAYTTGMEPGALVDIKLDLERIAAELDSVVEDLKKAGPRASP